MTWILSALSEISRNYDALFCDLWGCLHDGRRPFPVAISALREFRSGGGVVALVTNAPRPRAEVEIQLDRIGVPRDCWDAIATSGDSARVAMFEGAVGRKVHFIGYQKDLAFFEPPKVVESPVEISRVPMDEAEGIVCTGPEDPYAAPSVYRSRFLDALRRGLKLLCANPDVVVDFGDTRQWCAGALAELYAKMGGESLYFGKPHSPIYDLARRRLAALGRPAPDERILAIGDGPRTDVLGAENEGIDAIFVTGGIAREETGTIENPDPDALAVYLERESLSPPYAIGQLR